MTRYLILELLVKSSGLAVTVLTLVVTLVALDLSGAHQLPAQAPAATPASVIRVDDAQSEAAVTARLVHSVMESQSATATPFMNHGRVVHRCITVPASPTEGPLEYCLGAPAARIDYN